MSWGNLTFDSSRRARPGMTGDVVLVRRRPSARRPIPRQTSSNPVTSLPALHGLWRDSFVGPAGLLSQPSVRTVGKRAVRKDDVGIESVTEWGLAKVAQHFGSVAPGPAWAPPTGFEPVTYGLGILDQQRLQGASPT